MGVKNVNNLDKNLKTEIVNEDGTINKTTDDDISEANSWFCQQEDAISKGTTSEVIKKFFDYLPRRVFLPWLTALTDAANNARQRLANLTKTMDNNVQQQEDLKQKILDVEEDVELEISTVKLSLAETDLQLDTLKEKTIPAVDDRVKTLEEETIPAVDDRVEKAEGDIDLEKRRTELLLGDARGLIVSMALNPTEDEIVGEDAVDPTSMSIYVVSNLMKRNKLRGLEEDDENAKYYVLDVKEKALYYGNVTDYLKRSEAFEPILSMAALKAYDSKSECAMSGIAVEEALATFENETLPQKIQDYVDSEILGGEW